MSGSSTALLLLLSATTHLVTAASECFDVNIKYSSGAVLATHTWRWVLLAGIRHNRSTTLTPYRSPHECVPLCAGQATCTHWTWQGGACQLMAGATWTKLPGAGAISGVAGAACVAAPVLGNLSTRVNTCQHVSYCR